MSWPRHEILEIKGTIVMIDLFEMKTFVMHSGDIGHWKIECDALTDEDIETLAYIVSEKFKFAGVYGVPTGAIRIEKALRKYITLDSENFLIVDDVLTTGASMEEARNKMITVKRVFWHNIIGVVLFARIPPPEWVYPVFQLWNK